jgi:hypothetical protein
MAGWVLQALTGRLSVWTGKGIVPPILSGAQPHIGAETARTQIRHRGPIYHSGFVTERPERAYAEGAGQDGIDTLIASLSRDGVAPNSNVDTELGSTWRFLMRDPDSAVHAPGKLFKYVGQDNVVWGTDSIWYGSPQDQIQALRTFQIAPELRDRHGYPEITPALRAKVFGLNATDPPRACTLTRRIPVTR